MAANAPEDSSPYCSPAGLAADASDQSSVASTSRNHPLVDLFLLITLITVGVTGSFLTFCFACAMVTYSSVRVDRGGNSQLGNEDLGFLAGTLAALIVLVLVGNAMLKLISAD